MNLCKFVPMCVIALVPCLSQAIEPKTDKTLQGLNQCGVISDYNNEIRWMKIASNTVFDFNGRVKILVLNKFFVPLKSYRLFKDEYYVSYDYLPCLCNDILIHGNAFFDNQSQVLLIDYKHGMSPPSSKEIAEQAVKEALDFLEHTAEAALLLEACPPLACYKMSKATDSAGNAWDKAKEAYDAYQKEKNERELEALKDMTKKED